MKKLLFALVASFWVCAGCAGAPAVRDLTLQGDHGKLAAVMHAPNTKQKYPLVLILHGFNASKDMELLTELSDQLNAQGIATFLFDFNGHGQSEGSFLDMTIPNELQDARRVYDYVSKLPQVESVSLAGHSQGGVIAAMLAGELGAEKIKSVVLMSPAPELKDDTAKGDLFGVRYDPNNVPEYITLPTGLKVGRAFLETTPHLPVYEVSSRYTGPVMVLHSADDQLVPYQYGVRMSECYKNGRLVTLHGFDHNFTQNTPLADQVVTDFFTGELLKK